MIANTSFEPPYLLKNVPAIFGERTFLIDNNVLWRICRDETDENITRIRQYIQLRGFSHRPDFVFGATPLTVMEALYLVAPKCPLQAAPPQTADLNDCFAAFLEDATNWFLTQSELQEVALQKKGNDKRKEVRSAEALLLFDSTIIRECRSGTLGKRLASTLAWHIALDPKRYPKNIRPAVNEYILNMSLSSDIWPALSRFRRAKDYWDAIYRMRTKFSSDSMIPFEEINKAMVLKSNKDYLDCDLIHAACFGYFNERDLVIITEDEPKHMRWRASCYRSFITYAAKKQGVVPQRGVRANSIMVVDKRGQIRQEILPQAAPTVVFLGKRDERPEGLQIAGRIEKNQQVPPRGETRNRST